MAADVFAATTQAGCSPKLSWRTTIVDFGRAIANKLTPHGTHALSTESHLVKDTCTDTKDSIEAGGQATSSQVTKVPSLEEDCLESGSCKELRPASERAKQSEQEPKKPGPLEALYCASACAASVNHIEILDGSARGVGHESTNGLNSLAVIAQATRMGARKPRKPWHDVRDTKPQ
eukprot:6473087-Amphidinium_carterae.1